MPPRTSLQNSLAPQIDHTVPVTPQEHLTLSPALFHRDAVVKQIELYCQCFIQGCASGGLDGHMCIALDVMKNLVTFSSVIYIYVELITLWFNFYLTFTYYSLISLPTMPHLPKMLSLQEADTFSEQMFTVSKKKTRQQGMKLSELNLLKTTTRKQGMKSGQLNLLKTTTRKQGMKLSELNLLLNIESYVRNVWNPLKYKIFEYVQHSVSHFHCLESCYKVYSCVSSRCAI